MERLSPHNSYLSKFNSPVSHESGSSSESSQPSKLRSGYSRAAAFITRRKDKPLPPPSDSDCEIKENQYLPDTEVSFSKDAFEPTDSSPIRRRTQTRSPSSASSASTSDLHDLNSEIHRMLRCVLAQINPSTPTLHSGSYSASMILKRIKEKLEVLERLGKALDDRRKWVEDTERQAQMRLAVVISREEMMGRKEREWEQTEVENQREIGELKHALEETKRRLAARDADTKAYEDRGRVSQMEEELRIAAVQLERRTYDLLLEERELESKEEDLTQRLSAFTQSESELQKRKAVLDARERDLRTGRSGTQGETGFQVCRSLVTELIHAAVMRSTEAQTEALLFKLQRSESENRGVKGKPQTKSQGKKGRDISDLEPSETESVWIRREQALALAEASIKEHWKQLRADQAALESKASLLSEREEKCAEMELRLQSESPKRSMGQRDDLITREAKLEEQKTKVAKMWETVLGKLEHIQKAEKRLDTGKADFLLQTQRIKEDQTKEEFRLKEWEQLLNSRELSLRAQFAKDDKDAEIKLLKSELVVKESQLREKNRALSEQRKILSQAEETLERKSQEMESLVTEISKSLQSSPEKKTVGMSAEVQDFAQTFRMRQEVLRRHIDAADDEKREMCQTLKGFLSDLS